MVIFLNLNIIGLQDYIRGGILTNGK